MIPPDPQRLEIAREAFATFPVTPPCVVSGNATTTTLGASFGAAACATPIAATTGLETASRLFI
jgi:hypothetical protein